MTKDIEAEFRAWLAVAEPVAYLRGSDSDLVPRLLAAWTACARQHAGREAAAYAEGERAATARVRALVEVLRLRVRDGIPAWTIADEIRRLQGAIDAGPAVAEVAQPTEVPRAFGPPWCGVRHGQHECTRPPGHDGDHSWDDMRPAWMREAEEAKHKLAAPVAPAPSVVKVTCPKCRGDMGPRRFCGGWPACCHTVDEWPQRGEHLYRLCGCGWRTFEPCDDAVAGKVVTK